MLIVVTLLTRLIMPCCKVHWTLWHYAKNLCLAMDAAIKNMCSMVYVSMAFVVDGPNLSRYRIWSHIMIL